MKLFKYSIQFFILIFPVSSFSFDLYSIESEKSKNNYSVKVNIEGLKSLKVNDVANLPLLNEHKQVLITEKATTPDGATHWHGKVEDEMVASFFATFLNDELVIRFKPTRNSSYYLNGKPSNIILKTAQIISSDLKYDTMSSDSKSLLNPWEVSWPIPSFYVTGENKLIDVLVLKAPSLSEAEVSQSFYVANTVLFNSYFNSWDICGVIASGICGLRIADIIELSIEDGYRDFIDTCTELDNMRLGNPPYQNLDSQRDQAFADIVMMFKPNIFNNTECPNGDEAAGVAYLTVIYPDSQGNFIYNTSLALGVTTLGPTSRPTTLIHEVGHILGYVHNPSEYNGESLWAAHGCHLALLDSGYQNCYPNPFGYGTVMTYADTHLLNFSQAGSGWYLPPNNTDDYCANGFGGINPVDPDPFPKQECGINGWPATSIVSEFGYGWNAVAEYRTAPVLLTGLTLSGPDFVVENNSAQYTVTASFSDGSSQEVTGEATWSENSIYTSISQSGLLQAHEVPADWSVAVSVTYQHEGITKGDAKIVSIEDQIVLTGLSLSGPSSLEENNSAQFTAVALFSNGSTQAVNDFTDWSENSIYTTVTQTGILESSNVPADWYVGLSASYQHNGIVKNDFKVISILDSGIDLTGLYIDGPSVVDEGSTQQYQAIAQFSDGSQLSVVDSVDWSENSIHSVVTQTGLLESSSVPVDWNIALTASYRLDGIMKNATQIVTIADKYLFKEGFDQSHYYAQPSIGFFRVNGQSNGIIVNAGETVSVSWYTTNADICLANTVAGISDWNGSIPLFGNQTITIAATSSIQISCSNDNGIVTENILVTVN